MKTAMRQDENAIGETNERDWGSKSARMGTDKNAIGDLEKRRGLVVIQARARRDASEGSVESKRGLGDLVEANKKLRRS